MQVLVCGDREWSDPVFLGEALTALLKEFGPFVVIEGACRGADRMAGEWAELTEGVGRRTFPADWRRYGRGAGPVRNAQMLACGPDLVVAFHDSLETSAGTKNMVKQAEAHGCPVRVISHSGMEALNS